jgi:hypothetical protein
MIDYPSLPLPLPGGVGYPRGGGWYMQLSTESNGAGPFRNDCGWLSLSITAEGETLGSIRIKTDKGTTEYESREEAIQAYTLAHQRGEHPILSVSSEYEEPPPDYPIQMTALD